MAKRSSTQARADEASRDLARKLGRMIKDGRLRHGATQASCAIRAGISASEWSALELGRKSATLPTWNRAAFAVGGSLDAWVKHTSGADRPRDAVHLKAQELIVRTAIPGGWESLPEELIDREARTSRAADVLLHRCVPKLAAEYALAEVIDWFDDVGAPMREWQRRLDAVERYAIARMRPDEHDLPRIGGFWIVRATRRNRELIGEHRNLFRARFSGSGRAWLAALTDADAPMPTEPALLWITVSGDRLYAARWVTPG